MTLTEDRSVFPDEDVLPTVLEAAAADTPPARCSTEGCTEPLPPYAGRGRRPSRCAFHAAHASHKAGAPTVREVSGAATPPAQNRVQWREAPEVEKILETYLRLIAGGIVLVDEYDGSVIAAGAPAVAHELVELAKTDRPLRKWLTRMANPGKYGPLMLALTPVLFPILAHHNLVPQFKVPTTPGEGESE